MIWGKKKTETIGDITTRIQEGESPNWYAWRPMKLRDGRWAWFEKVYSYFETWRVGGKTYFEIP